MQNIASILKTFLIVIVASVVIGYAYFETKDFARGPVIAISTPLNGETIQDSPINIAGAAKNISYISVNDRQIFTDEEGFFSEKLLLYPGYNIISVKAKDRFDRNTEKVLEVVYLKPRVSNTQIMVPNTSEFIENSASSTDTTKLNNLII